MAHHAAMKCRQVVVFNGTKTRSENMFKFLMKLRSQNRIWNVWELHIMKIRCLWCNLEFPEKYN